MKLSPDEQAICDRHNTIDLTATESCYNCPLMVSRKGLCKKNMSEEEYRKYENITGGD